jgi:hypothetical protein
MYSITRILHLNQHYYFQQFLEYLPTRIKKWTILIPVANAVEMLPRRVVPNVTTNLAKIAPSRQLEQK